MTAKLMAQCQKKCLIWCAGKFQLFFFFRFLWRHTDTPDLSLTCPIVACATTTTTTNRQGKVTEGMRAWRTVLGSAFKVNIERKFICSTNGIFSGSACNHAWELCSKCTCIINRQHCAIGCSCQFTHVFFFVSSNTCCSCLLTLSIFIQWWPSQWVWRRMLCVY